MRKPISSPLANIQVSTPCSVSWEKMDGDERARMCKECKLHVYNLSEMSRNAAEKLIFEKEGKLCVRFIRRQDGTILTQDCPIVLRRLKARLESLRAIAIFLGACLFSICRAHAEGPFTTRTTKVSSKHSTVAVCGEDNVLVLKKQQVGCGPCNPLDSNSALFYCEPTTQFFHAGKKLKLENGKLVVLTKNEHVDIECKYGTVTIAPNAGAILESKESWKYIRVANLIGKNAEIEIDSDQGRKQKFSVAAGEEICITTRDLYEQLKDHLVPVDGVSRSAWTMGIAFWPGIRNSFDQKAMLENEPLLKCTEKSTAASSWIASLRKRISEQKKSR